MADYVITPLPEDDDVVGMISYLGLYVIQMLETNEKRFYHFADIILSSETSSEELEAFYLKALSKIPVYRLHRTFKTFILHPNTPAVSLRYLLNKIDMEEQNSSQILSASYNLLYSDLRDFILEHPSIRKYKQSVLSAEGLDLSFLLPEWEKELFSDLGLPLVLSPKE